MNFTEKAASVRTSVTETNNSINNTDVYDELILQAVELTNPSSIGQEVELNSYTVGSYSIISGYYSYSLKFSDDFTGYLQGYTIEANTIINLTAKTTLNSLSLDVLTGSVLFVAINN